jgi:hypothetical protein
MKTMPVYMTVRAVPVTQLARGESVIKCPSPLNESWSMIHTIIAVIEHAQMNINT